jgi:dCTP deaminase
VVTILGGLVLAILTGNRIREHVALGNIVIDPYEDDQINPNSINLRLGNELKTYDSVRLSMKEANLYTLIPIPPEGIMLWPGRLYLGSTVERIHSKHFVPVLDGRSSVGRLGIQIHSTAGYGDLGFDGTFTLELSVVQPVLIFAGVEICQMSFHEVSGDTTLQYRGKYNHQSEPRASMLYREFLPRAGVAADEHPR